MDENIIIKAEHLSKVYKLYNKKSDRLKELFNFTNKSYYKEHYALSDISFEIKNGETLGIMGVNGAGKSTLLKILTGVTTPSSGTISIRGKISALLELGAGFNSNYTGLENIYLNGTMMGYSTEEMEKKVSDIVEFAEIGEYIYQPVKNYSSGMFARLAFSVAISVEPEILIVDEALSVGDMRFQMKCINKMKSLMDQGTTVLFVSHDINIIRRFCKRGIWLDQGKIRMMGEINDVADAYTDYLKELDGPVENDDNVDQNAMLEIFKKPFTPNNGIAEILGVRILDEYGNDTEGVRIGQPIKVELVYDVYDEVVEEPVAGIAVFGVNDEYLCGVNTLLDKKRIPWKYGRNVIKLNYFDGIRLLGGKYYLTAALFDGTASVAIDFRSRLLLFTVRDKYLGEGKFIIPHRWET